jgi:hypothetical protein
MRCDGVNPGMLGMDKVISEDALRNALKRMPQAPGCTWLDRQLSESVSALLDAPWILDTDTTIKPLMASRKARSFPTAQGNPVVPPTGYQRPFGTSSAIISSAS